MTTVATPSSRRPRPSLSGSVDATFSASGTGLRLAGAATPPLELRGPFVDDATPDAPPRYFLRNVTAGVFGGDRYDVRVHAEAGVRVRVQPTSATRVHGSRGDTARVATRLEAGSGAALTFDAGVTILQQGASLEQSVMLSVAPGGRLHYLEVVALGRLASGERLEFERFASSLRACVAGGRESFCEAFELQPHRDRALIDAAVGAASVLGVLVILGDTPSIEASLLSSDSPVFVGSSALPRGGGVIVRALGGRVEPVSAVLARIIESTR